MKNNEKGIDNSFKKGKMAQFSQVLRETVSATADVKTLSQMVTIKINNLNETVITEEIVEVFSIIFQMMGTSFTLLWSYYSILNSK